jgi:hypothetical protein
MRFQQQHKAWQFQQLVECLRRRSRNARHWRTTCAYVKWRGKTHADACTFSRCPNRGALPGILIHSPRQRRAASIYGAPNFWDTKGMKYLPMIVVLLVCGCRPQAEGVSSGSDSRPAPIPEVVSLDGHWRPVLVDIHDQELSPFESDAKALALIFVLQDCPIANSYMPELNRLHESFQSRGIQLIVVETDPQITQQQARDHAEQYQIK